MELTWKRKCTDCNQCLNVGILQQNCIHFLPTKFICAADLGFLEAVGTRSGYCLVVLLLQCWRFNHLQKNFSALSIKGGFVGKGWSSAQQHVKCTDSKCNEHTGFQGSCTWRAALGQCLDSTQVKLQWRQTSNSCPSVLCLTDTGVILALYLKCMPCLLNTANILLTQCTFE